LLANKQRNEKKMRVGERKERRRRKREWVGANVSSIFSREINFFNFNFFNFNGLVRLEILIIFCIIFLFSIFQKKIVG
jgi:hypothetical protein